ncbi:MAG: hypothetical protein IJY85_07135 [Ruminococcus sp.]|nr:hypothetical protein [Ruminococcus sp.]
MRMLKNKHINLYARYTEKPQSAEKAHSSVGWIPVICVLLCLAVFLIVLISSNMTLRSRKEELALLRREVEDPLLLEEADQASQEELQAQMAERILESVEADLAALAAADAVLQGLDQDLLNIAADGGAEVRVTAISWKNGVLSITAVAERAEQIPVYVTALEESAKFSAVRYAGYRQNDENHYTFTVSAVTNQ